MRQSSPPHQDKAEGVKGAIAGENDDMAGDASFYVFSFGFAREFTLQHGSGLPNGKDGKKLKQSDIVWQKALASGSLLKVSAQDNRELHHAVHKMKGAGERWSLIFRVIKTFIPVEPDVADEVNHSMYRFVSKAQEDKGRTAPTKSELDSFAERQGSFRKNEQRKAAIKNGEKIPGIPLAGQAHGTAGAVSGSIAASASGDSVRGTLDATCSPSPHPIQHAHPRIDPPAVS